MSLHSPVAAVATFTALVALGGCAENTGTDDAPNPPRKTLTTAVSYDAADNSGPAPDISGARKGGTLRILQQDDYAHLDPQRTYSTAAQALLQMVTRTLTTFKEDGTGRLTLVGDLAENPGKDVNKDCKTWEYRLRPGVLYEDGRKVTAGDVAYGIARSFEEGLDGGATYLQEWLADDQAYNSSYKGPYTSGRDAAPGVTVKDRRTLVFTFARPRCDLPFALTLPTSVPVPKDKDTRDGYDERPFSLGPYKIKERLRDSRTVLERNQHWDPATDPIRHAYPDEIVVEVGPDDTAQTERVRAGRGTDAYATALDGVPQALINEVLDDEALHGRTLGHPTALLWYLNINNQRITDVNVRRAIAYAIDKQSIMAAVGGDARGRLTHTLLPEQTLGYREYPNPYPAPPTGDPEKARELLGDRKIKLVLLNRTSAQYQRIKPILTDSLEKAGFEVVTRDLEAKAHRTAISTRDNEYDLSLVSWIPDWPTGAATLPVNYDGRKIGPMGNSNTSYFTDDTVNAEFDRALALPADQAAAAWTDLDEKLMKEHCPSVPLYAVKALTLNGSNVGGVFISDWLGQQVYYDAYLR